MPRIRTNSVYGLLGFAFPTLVVLLAYPIILRHVGAAAMGIYILCGSVGGTIGSFDFGFGLATVRFIAQDVSRGRLDDASKVLATSLAFYGALGAFGAMTLYILAPWIVAVFKVSAGLHDAGIWSFRIAAVQLLFTFLSSVFLAVFKGLQRFKLNAICVSLLSVLTNAGAAASAVYLNAGLVGISLIALLANAFVFAITAALGIRICVLAGISPFRRPGRSVFRRMIGFGSVTTVNSFSLLLTYNGQRYLLGVLLGPAAVTIYQLASMIPLRAQSAIASICEVLFPVASAARDSRVLRKIYLKMLCASSLLAGAALGGLSVIATRIIPLWLRDPSLSRSVVPLIPIFGIGVFFLSTSVAPYFLVYGIGRPGLNSAFTGFNVVLNLLILGILALFGPVTLTRFSWAYTSAQVVSAVLFHLALELLVWRPMLSSSRHAAAFGGWGCAADARSTD